MKSQHQIVSAGMILAAVSSGLAAVRYADANSSSPTPPYTSWATAALTIQQAVDAAAPGDEIVVTNGTYATGGQTVGTNLLANRVAVDKPVSVRSVNGPQFTVIQGYQVPGGGGGGADSCTLNNCTLTGNRAAGGGGAFSSTLKSCTLTENSASGSSWGAGGGAAESTLNNCIVYFNTSRQGSNYDSSSIMNYCCTTQQPPNGFGNMSVEPRFLNRIGNNLRLQSNSPCINAGNNAYAPGTTDLDGRVRVVGGTVDIGAYEFQTPASLISFAWLQQYRLPTYGSADFTDADGDGLSNWQEWRCGTDPTNALSALRLVSPSPTSTSLTVSWQSVAGVTYFLERSTNLAVPPVFRRLARNILGEPGTTTYTDTNGAATGPFFYRVGVGNSTVTNETNTTNEPYK